MVDKPDLKLFELVHLLTFCQHLDVVPFNHSNFIYTYSKTFRTKTDSIKNIIDCNNSLLDHFHKVAAI